MKKSLKLLLASTDHEREEDQGMVLQGPETASNVVYLPQAYEARWEELELAARERTERKGTVGYLARRARARLRSAICGEAGMATAEYAIATLAAVGFAALLIAILKSNEVRGFLMAIIENALSF